MRICVPCQLRIKRMWGTGAPPYPVASARASLLPGPSTRSALGFCCNFISWRLAEKQRCLPTDSPPSGIDCQVPEVLMSRRLAKSS